MTTDDLRNINPAIAALLEQARSEHEQTSRTLAELETDAAARLLRHLVGEQATSALLDKDIDEDGDTRITILVVYDTSDEPIWVNTLELDDYPGLGDLTDADLDALPDNLRYPIEDHLQRAYDLCGGAGPSVEPATDDHIDSSSNLLLLDIAAAAPGA